MENQISAEASIEVRRLGLSNLDGSWWWNLLGFRSVLGQLSTNTHPLSWYRFCLSFLSYVDVVAAECACLRGGRGRDHGTLVIPCNWPLGLRKGFEAEWGNLEGDPDTVGDQQSFLNRKIVGTTKSPINGENSIWPIRPCESGWNIMFMIRPGMGMNGESFGKGYVVIRVRAPPLAQSLLGGWTAWLEIRRSPSSWSSWDRLFGNIIHQTGWQWQRSANRF